MTYVKLDKNDKAIQSADDVVDAYAGFGGSRENMRMGGETERVFHSRNEPAEMMTTGQQAAYVDALRKRTFTGLDGQPRLMEPALETVSQVVEEQTQAAEIAVVGDIIRQESEMAGHAYDIASSMDLRQCPLTANPMVTHDQCYQNPVAEPRSRTDELMHAIYDTSGHDGLSYTFLTSPVHASVSYTDSAHLWDIIQTSFALTPFLYMACENGVDYMEGESKFSSHHFSMRTTKALGRRGGIPEHFYHARSGEEFIYGHVNAVLDNPMMVVFDKEGEIYAPRSGQLKTPRNIIEEQGAINQSVFDLAESTLWPDIKICNIRDSENNRVGKRIELRMCDTGPHQFQSLMLTTAGAIMNEQGRHEMNALLRDFGFDGPPGHYRQLLEQAMHDTLWHGGRYMDIAFGQALHNGKQPTMHDFAKEAIGVIREGVKRVDSGLLPKLQPLEAIGNTGWTDAKTLTSRFTSLSAVQAFMRSCPEDVYTRPNGTCYCLMEEAGELNIGQRPGKRISAPGFGGSGPR